MSKHSEYSSFREKLIEHLFVGELLKLSWQRGNCTLTIASLEVDNSGCDVIAEDRQFVRHSRVANRGLDAETDPFFGIIRGPDALILSRTSISRPSVEANGTLSRIREVQGREPGEVGANLYCSPGSTVHPCALRPIRFTVDAKDAA